MKTKRYSILTTLTIVLIAALALVVAYKIVVIGSDFRFKLEWNMFKSILIYPLYAGGIVVGIVSKIQKMRTYKVTKWNGEVKDIRPDDDITTALMDSILMPLLTRLFFIPLMVSAAIYYPLMGIIYVFGAIIPYLLAIVVLGIAVFYFGLIRGLISSASRHILVPLAAVVFIFILWGIYCMWNGFSFQWNDLPTIVALSIAGLSLILFFGLILTSEEDEPALELGEENGEVDSDFSRNVKSPPLLYGGIALVAVLLAVGGYFMFSTTTNLENEVPIAEASSPQVDGNVSASHSTTGTEKLVDKTKPSEKVEEGNTATTTTEPKAAITTAAINIPAMTGSIKSLDADYSFYATKKIAEGDRAKLHIDKISKAINTNEVSRGKLIYSCSAGKIETFIHAVHNERATEYLVSYCPLGNYIAHVAIGLVDVYGGSRSYGKFAGNKLTVFSSSINDDDDVTYAQNDYKITEDLRFIR